MHPVSVFYYLHGETSFPSQSGGTQPVGTSGTQGRLYLPVTTLGSPHEADEKSDLKAYKLGKGRWLYNECRLNILTERGQPPPFELHVQDAKRLSDNESSEMLSGFEECAAAYSCKLSNDTKIMVCAYLGYNEPKETMSFTNLSSDYYSSSSPQGSSHRSCLWPAAQRADCCNENRCSGQILRPIKRYGRVSKRSGRRKAASVLQDDRRPSREDRAKDPRYLYLAIDEASSHVSDKLFRLVFAVFDENRKPLGTSMSPPILVLANNDAPDGPAVIDVNLSLDDEWTGWRQPRGPEAGSGPGVSSNYHLSPASDMGSQRQGRMSTSSDASESRDPHYFDSQLNFIRRRALENLSPQGSDDLDHIGNAAPRHFQAPQASYSSAMRPSTAEALGLANGSSWSIALGQKPAMLEGSGSIEALRRNPMGLPLMTLQSQSSEIMSGTNQGVSSGGGSIQTWNSFSPTSQYGSRLLHAQIGGSNASTIERVATRRRYEGAFQGSLRQASAPVFSQSWSPMDGSPLRNWNARYGGPASRESNIFSIPPLETVPSMISRMTSQPEPLSHMVPVPSGTGVSTVQNPFMSSRTEQEGIFNPFAGQDAPQEKPPMPWCTDHTGYSSHLPEFQKGPFERNG